MVSLIDTLDQAVENDWPDEIAAAEQAIRAASAGIVSPIIAQAVQRPFLKQYCKTLVGRGNISNDIDMLNELYLYFQANALRVQSRAFTFGTALTVGTAIGNGQIIRLTKDRYNFDTENCFVETIRARCVSDQETGTNRGEEIFSLLGQSPSRDDLQRSGSGSTGTLQGVTTDQSFLFNASWSQFGGTAAAPTSITNWTSSATVNSTNYDFDATNYFRLAPSDGSTGYALNVKATTVLSQKLSVRGTRLSNDLPYLMAVVWNRAVGSGSGTLVLRMGSANTSVAVSAQTGWNVTICPAATPSQSCWYRQFALDDMQVAIDWTKTSGNILIDDVLFIEGTPFASNWWWALPGNAATYTPWRVLDEYTFANNATDSKVQRWIWRAWNFYLPHSLGSGITFADP